MAKPMFDAMKLNGTTGNLGSIVGKARGIPVKNKKKINKKARKKGAGKR